MRPFGPELEGQAYAYSTRGGRVSGERLSGDYSLVQYPRRRSDDVLLPDAHGMVRASRDQIVMTRFGGFGVPAGPGRRAITHWMRFVAAGEFAWLNGVIAAGVGVFVDEVARVRYVEIAPTPPGETGDEGTTGEGLKFSLLGTATWEYRSHETTRPFGDREGQAFGQSVGRVDNGELAGSWRGWHYSAVRRDGLNLLDAHAEVATSAGSVLVRFGGLATRPVRDETREHGGVEVHYATFLTEVPRLNHLNTTLAFGVGWVGNPGGVTLSYYSLGAASA
ncbi:MAG: hypothetical protein E6I87_07300 [Chloroflexi bacterium]|nr:MAG: hypothetical protein E6I87_07300 [Chloroflexota bacterium]